MPHFSDLFPVLEDARPGGEGWMGGVPLTLLVVLVWLDLSRGLGGGEGWVFIRQLRDLGFTVALSLNP